MGRCAAAVAVADVSDCSAIRQSKSQRQQQQYKRRTEVQQLQARKECTGGRVGRGRGATTGLGTH